MKRRGQGNLSCPCLGVEKNPVPALMVWVERAANQKQSSCGGNHERRKDYRPHYVISLLFLVFTDM